MFILVDLIWTPIVSLSLLITNLLFLCPILINHMLDSYCVHFNKGPINQSYSGLPWFLLCVFHDSLLRVVVCLFMFYVDETFFLSTDYKTPYLLRGFFWFRLRDLYIETGFFRFLVLVWWSHLYFSFLCLSRAGSKSITVLLRLVSFVSLEGSNARHAGWFGFTSCCFDASCHLLPLACCAACVSARTEVFLCKEQRKSYWMI